MAFLVTFKTKWADFDPNRHMRHTAYSDYAAEVRVRFFQAHNLSMNDFALLHIGPIIFEEETKFFKEINIGEDISVDMELLSATKNFSRWSFIHHVYNKNEELSAIVKVKGAWLNLQERKLTDLPDKIINHLRKIPKSKNFKYLEQ